jgi:hypothetical protein
MPAPALAESEMRQAVQPVEKSLNTLVTIRDNDSLSASEKAEQELAARKEVLKGALTLSIEETKNLADRLKLLPEFGAETKEKGMQNAFAGALQSYAVYYEKQLTKVNDLDSDAAVKALAQEIKTYRETIHNPNIQNIVDFVLLFQNDSVITTAKTRHTKIVSDMRKLEKRGFIKAGVFDEPLGNAASLISKAETLNLQAKDVMFAEPKEKEGEDEETPIEKEKAPSARELLVASFDNVRDAYTIFLSVSKDVRSLLGIE